MSFSEFSHFEKIEMGVLNDYYIYILFYFGNKTVFIIQQAGIPKPISLYMDYMFFMLIIGIDVNCGFSDFNSINKKLITMMITKLFILTNVIGKPWIFCRNSRFSFYQPNFWNFLLVGLTTKIPNDYFKPS